MDQKGSVRRREPLRFRVPELPGSREALQVWVPEQNPGESQPERVLVEVAFDFQFDHRVPGYEATHERDRLEAAAGRSGRFREAVADGHHWAARQGIHWHQQVSASAKESDHCFDGEE